MENNTMAIMNALKNMDDSELVSIWNEYCYATNTYDDEIFTMDLFDEVYANYDPIEVATRVFYGHDEWNDESSFNPNREYFYLNGYGNPVSIDYIGYNEYKDEFMCPFFDESALCEYIIDNNETFNNDTLEYVMAELKEGME